MAESAYWAMKSPHLFSSRTKFYFVTLAALFLLTIVYNIYVARYWGHLGFSSNFNILKILVSVVVLGIFCAGIPRESRTTQGFFLSLIILIQLIPMLVLYSAAGIEDIYALVAVLGVFLVFLASYTPIAVRNFGIIGIKATEILILLFSIVLVILVIMYAGLDSFNLNIANVYQHRGEALDKVPVVFNYIISITTKFLIPLGIVISLHRKKYTNLVVLVVCSIALFGLSSHKSIVFYGALAAVIYSFWRYWRNIPILAAMFVLALLVGVIDAFMFSSQGWSSIWGWYVSLGIRRALMVPALLNYLHIDFFWNNPPIFWSGSRITLGLLDYPYELMVPNLIGDVYFNNPETSANTGYIGSGFSQAGFIGLALYSVGVGLVISLFNSIGNKFGHEIVVAAVSAQIVTMVLSADFVTMFLTHGLIVSILFLIAVRFDRDARQETKPNGIVL